MCAALIKDTIDTIELMDISDIYAKNFILSFMITIILSMILGAVKTIILKNLYKIWLKVGMYGILELYEYQKKKQRSTVVVPMGRQLDKISTVVP